MRRPDTSSRYPSRSMPERSSWFRLTAMPAMCGCSWQASQIAGTRLRLAVRRKQRGEIRDLQRLREEIALRVLAAQASQIGDLLERLDAFGDDGQAQGSRHLDDGAHDGGVAILVLDARNERAVDLERRHRKAGEV